ncbi:MAG: DNA methyltransferase [Gaiellaceae bacterium]
MALSAEEIRGRLSEFAAKWAGYSGSERSEAQTFLNELLACYGTDRMESGALFEERGGPGFIDMIWPGVCIVEMKRPSEAARLADHREQAFEYWKAVSRDTGTAGRFVVVCAFLSFEVFEPGSFWDRPVATFSLAELPDRSEALDFLREREPLFTEDKAELTREAVALVTDLYNRIRDRQAAGAETLRDFVLQCVWSMFAEDLAMIPEHRFTRIVERLLGEPGRSSSDDLGGLFEWLNRPGERATHGLYADVPYADGGLFAAPAEVHLDRDELDLLREACTFDWKLVEPSIFGNLLEGALGRERVWAFGAHYTAEADIRKVVEPTIVEPWRERIESCSSLAKLEQLQREFGDYKILDPACGSGNFLYVAYRELRRLEARLRARERELRAEGGLASESHTPAYPLSNVFGLEVEPFAIKLARVTLWMAHKLAVEELALEEAVLPLGDLSGIRRADALKVEWPPADAIIGNPPYHGSQQIRSELGDDYAEWLKREFGVGLKDYAVYWFRKAHQAMPDGGRAGLVATNSVSQGRSREVSLDWILKNGGVIVNAISKQPWPGAAVVNVSIVNWVKRPSDAPTRLVLDEAEVEGITSSLRPRSLETSQATRLAQNAGKAFQGPIPAGSGFVLTEMEASELLSRTDADYTKVVRPYLVGEDIAEDPAQRPRRWIIDFASMPMEDAQRWPAAFEIVRERVRPERMKNRRKLYRERWWNFAEPRRGMRAALAPLDRYVAGIAQGKRIHFAWQDPATCPSNLTNVFAFDDDYSIGVLVTQIHHEWARAQSSTLRIDIRYTPTTAFEPFPWPQPSPEQREAIAEAARAVIARRSEICLDRGIGLTKLYNEVDEGAYRDLRDLHTALDEAVAAAYGWPKSAAHDPTESNRRLLDLNEAITAGRIDYSPF